MNKYFQLKKLAPLIKLLITTILFLKIKDINSINSFSSLAVSILEFIIILELVRMLVEFIISDDNRIKLRFMIDSTIVFFIRDIMLIANDTFNYNKIFIILGVIAILFIFRIVSIKYSPSVL